MGEYKVNTTDAAVGLNAKLDMGFQQGETRR